ncbi:MAG: polysaccharide biosynthesis protein [Clostridiales bacterium]|jgi:stage V sporulation protein B|nr:polysaccharide biosynthesis protein [Clostridiales bacterium]
MKKKMRVRTMKQQDFFRGASILAFAGFVTKFIGALYRIPLTNIIGAEAIGMYQLVFSVYALFLTTSTGGLPTGLSKLIAETKATGEGSGETGRIVGSSLGLSGLTGLIISVVLMIFSKQIAAVQGNPVVSMGYTVIAPAIFFVSIIAVMRGYFQGEINMVPTATSQIVEQVIKLVAGLALAAVMIKKGIMYGAVGAILGVVISELAAAIYLYVLFLKSGGRLDIAISLRQLKSDFKKVAKYSIPITIGGVLMPLTQFIDSFLVVNILNKAGFSLNISTSLYGILTGPVSSLINFPVIITIALAVVIIPVVSRQKTHRNIREILDKSNFAIKIAVFVGIPAAILFITFSGEIMRILYPGFTDFEISTASSLLRISATGIMFLAGMQIFTALLQALDKQLLPIRNMAAAMIVKIILNIVLIKAVGISGAALSTVISYFTAALLNFVSLSRLIGFKKNIFLAFAKVFAAGAIATLFTVAVKNFISNMHARLFLMAAAAMLIYFFVLLFTEFFTSDEMRSLPAGKFLLKITSKDLT